MVVKVVIPLAVGQLFTYAIPTGREVKVVIGKRVDVQFNKRHTTGVIFSVHNNAPTDPLLSVQNIIDDQPIVTEEHLNFWHWIADYYCCSIGEVMYAALPGALRLQPESRLQLNKNWRDKSLVFTDLESDIIEFLSENKSITVNETQKLLPKKEGLKLLDSLVKRGVILSNSNLESDKKVIPYQWIIMHQKYLTNTDAAFELCKSSKHQSSALLEYYSLYQKKKAVRYDQWGNDIPSKRSVLEALEKKGIIKVELSINNNYQHNNNLQIELNDEQLIVFKKISSLFKLNKKPILLHGVTGSGKTHIYFKLFKEEIKNKGQVLYLVPEIALTIQLVNRIQNTFGDMTFVYNYKTSSKERLRIWNKVLAGEPIIILGARSSIFLPFTRLQLIVVDEEHDSSYKQSDVNPRYNARDAAVYLAGQKTCNILLGTATPSVETYFNGSNAKYDMVDLNHRHKGIKMPEVKIIDLKKYPFTKESELISKPLLNEMRSTLENKKQIIIFLNKRGFHTLTFCKNCLWNKQCYQCDVSLVHHLNTGKLHCHQCGVNQSMPDNCPSCGNELVDQKGYGTQKIEEEIKHLFPQTRIQRLDTDSVRGKKSYQRIISSFGAGKLDILIGTQMITKGLDFDGVGLVGVLQGDQLLKYPDFRSVEYTFQLLIQVGGRAGRKDDDGQVFIQSYDTIHPVFNYIKGNDYKSFYQNEISQRSQFGYPPFTRLINIEIRHKKLDKLKQAVKEFNASRSERLKIISYGPTIPLIARLRGYFRNTYLLKIKNTHHLRHIKSDIIDVKKYVLKTKGLSGTKIIIDVDPR